MTDQQANFHAMPMSTARRHGWLDGRDGLERDTSDWSDSLKKAYAASYQNGAKFTEREARHD